MRNEHDLSKSRKNPYSAKLKKQIPLRLDEDAIEYFKAVSEVVGIPYQTRIDIHLRDCAASNRKPSLGCK